MQASTPHSGSHSDVFQNGTAEKDDVPDEYGRGSGNPPASQSDWNIIGEPLSPSTLFSVAHPFIATDVVPPDQMLNIFSNAGYFPAGITSFLGFETYVKDHPSRTDWAFSVSGKGPARKNLAAFLDSGNFPVLYGRGTTWRSIRNFCQTWADCNSQLSAGINGMWFEFDLPGPAYGPVLPSVFFNPVCTVPGKATKPEKWEESLKSMLALLTGKSVPAAVHSNLRNVLGAIPPAASLFMVGVMLSRKTDAVRLVIQFRNPDPIPGYLASVGWDHNPAPVISLLKDLVENGVNRFVLNVDAGPAIGDKIGLEASFAPTLFHREERWAQLFRYLRIRGHLTEKRYNAFMSFPGITGRTLQETEPGAAGRKRPDTEGGISRYFSHMKFVFEPESPPAVKVYCAIRQLGAKSVSSYDTPVPEGKIPPAGGPP
jgi:hypothetical protein